MCLILFAFEQHAEYPLIVIANRDEYYARPTRSAHWWDDADVFAEVRVDKRTPDTSIDALLGGSAGSAGSSRYLDGLDGTAVVALLDRNPLTAWLVEPINGEAATLRFGERVVEGTVGGSGAPRFH